MLIIVALFVSDTALTGHEPVHIHLQSSGNSAMLTVGNDAHAFVWPTIPRDIAILPNDPYVRDWGIDGSQSLTLSIANLDAAYLRSIQGSPYVAFDRWLRGEDTYDRWDSVRLTNSADGRVVRGPDASGFDTNVPLPSSFAFDADIQRLEQPVVIQFTVAGGNYQLRLDRANRQISVNNNTVANAPAIGQWYFPDTIGPYLAINLDTLAHGVAWSALLLLLATLIGACLPKGRIRWSATRQWAGRAAVVLISGSLATSFALMIYIALVEYNGMPHIFDAHGYLFQAKMLASGRLSIPPPAFTDSFPIPFFGTVNGQWVAQYSPGTASILALGVILGCPWLVQPLLGLGTLALVGAICRRLFGTQTAVIAVVLGSWSPFFLFQVGTYLSHIEAVFFATLAYYLLIRAHGGQRLWLTIAAAACVGMTFLCREVTGLLIVIPFTVVIGVRSWLCIKTAAQPLLGRMRRATLTAGAWLGGIAIFVALYMCYNWSITGRPLVSVRSITDANDRWGFGPGNGWWGLHTPAAGLVNTDQLLTGLNLELFGWPYYMALAIPLLPFVLARANRWDLLNAFIAVSVIAFYIGYYANGIAIGPRYYYEAVPVLLLLSARGIMVLGEAAGDMLGRLGRAWSSGPIAAIIVLVTLIAANVVFYLPRHMQLYHNFTAIAWMPNLQVSRIYGGAPHDSIVVTPDWYIYSNELAALNDPTTLASPTSTTGTVWALASTPARYAELTTAFPHRKLYILLTDGSSVSFQPWKPTVR